MDDQHHPERASCPHPRGHPGSAAGLYMLTAAASTTAALLEVVVIAGLDLVVTGALGHCPLYQKLGHVPATLKGRTS